MPNLKFNPMEYVTLGAVAGVVSYLASKLIAMTGGVTIKASVIDIAAQRGAFTNIGATILKFTPFNPTASWMTSLLVMVIAGIAVVFVGRLLYALIPLDTFLGARTPGKRVASILVLGSITLGMFLTKTGLPLGWTFAALIIWAWVLGAIISWIASLRGSPVKIPTS